jgi:hypothetical protein
MDSHVYWLTPSGRQGYVTRKANSVGTYRKTEFTKSRDDCSKATYLRVLLIHIHGSFKLHVFPSVRVI